MAMGPKETKLREQREARRVKVQQAARQALAKARPKIKAKASERISKRKRR
jgi:hypothetical protein